MPDDAFKSSSAGAAAPAGQTVNYAVRRSVPRFPFIADAEVTDLASGTRLSTRISELSLKGCYVDTLNAFPEGSEVRFRILTDKGVFDTGGKVIYVHPGIGMGIGFTDTTADQCTLLTGWLASRGE
jgi:hypothetical protein